MHPSTLNACNFFVCFLNFWRNILTLVSLYTKALVSNESSFYALCFGFGQGKSYQVTNKTGLGKV